MQIIVVGGGIGGLACAVGFRNGGHEVTVLEKAPVLAEIGAGINITPNATRALRALGVLPAVLEYANFPDYAAILRYDNLEKLSDQRLGELMEELYGAPYIVIHRYDLHAVLYREALRLGVKVLLSQGIVSANSDLGSVTTSDGTVFQGDLVVAADGEKSVCRELVNGEPYPSKDSGDHVFRVTIPGDKVRSIPDLAHLVERPSINLLVGPGGHAMTYSLKRDGLLNIVLTMKHEGIEDPPQLPHPVDLSEAREAFSGWDAVQVLLDQANSTSRWTLLETKLAEKWVKGKVVLMGDAAHVMLPFLGQGAAMALEDSVVLSTMLKGFSGQSTGLEDILQRFVKARQPRVEYLKSKARAMRDVYAHPDGAEQQARDQLLADEMDKVKAGQVDGDFAKDSPNFLADVPFRNFLFGYDAEADGKLG